MFQILQSFFINILNFFWNHKISTISSFLISSLVLFLGIILVSYFTEPTSIPQNVRVTNVSALRATVSWTTDKPTRGLVLISKDSKFPLLPFLSNFTYKDDGDKNIKSMGLYTTHHVTINRLDPEQVYDFRIYQGWHKAGEGKLSTISFADSISLPQPIYGQVLAADKKTPLVGALVYYWVKKSNSESTVLSTLTNLQGGWSVDASGLKSSDFKSNFKIEKNIEEIIIIDTGKGRVQSVSKPGNDQPWPTVIYTDK